MPSLKKRSQNRLSSIFSTSSTTSDRSTTSDDGRLQAPSGFKAALPNKLYKASFARSTEQIPSGRKTPPVVPAPSSQQPGVLPRQRPISQQLNTDGPDFLPIPPPPTVFEPFHTRSHSQPPSGTSTPALSTPASESPQLLAPSNADQAKLKRRSWFGSSKDERHKGQANSAAWVLTHDGNLPYNLDLLVEAERVPELWDEEGNTYIYLFPRTSNKGPSFRIDSSVIAASPFLTRLAFGRMYSDTCNSPGASVVRRKPVESAMRSVSLNDPTQPPSVSPEMNAVETESSASSKGSRALSDEFESSEVHVYLPVSLSTDNAIYQLGASEPQLSSDDVEMLVSIRNFFAVLVGGSLVGTHKNPDLFSVFMSVSKWLERYEFSNIDGSTYGEVAATSFDKYIDELNLADVRYSRQKTIEGLILGERMRSWRLYNESFVHAVGKYEDITELKSPLFELINPVTRNRMERASMDLYLRQKSINTRLEDFEFPAIFAGIMSSKTAEERKLVRFEAWKAGFIAMRKHILTYYKHRYGSWLPKASSKKNNLETNGLNRLVLLDLYQDFASLYDMLVDRSGLTTRGPDGPLAEDTDAVCRALRAVLSEYDRSSPPVQPAVPFDVPLLPTLATVRSDYGHGDEKKDAKARSKKVKSEEIPAVLEAARNKDADTTTTFLDAYRELERRSARGKTIDEICDFRCGYWIFVYAVLQSLPMLVVDAPGVMFTTGVEYFLCEVPRSGVPWARDADGTQQRNWYGVAGSTGVVSLPADVVEHGVEGIYRRSHCWIMAEKWTAHSKIMSSAVQELGAAQVAGSALPPSFSAPAAVTAPDGSPMLRPASAASHSGSSRRESVMMLGLEALPLPAGISPPGAASSRPGSRGGSIAPADPTKTFDAILSSVDDGSKKKK